MNVSTEKPQTDYQGAQNGRCGRKPQPQGFLQSFQVKLALLKEKRKSDKVGREKRTSYLLLGKGKITIVRMSWLDSSSLFCQEVTNQNKSGIAILVSEEIDFQQKALLQLKMTMT